MWNYCAGVGITLIINVSVYEAPLPNVTVTPIVWVVTVFGNSKIAPSVLFAVTLYPSGKFEVSYLYLATDKQTACKECRCENEEVVIAEYRS